METELLRDINPVPADMDGMDQGRMAQFFNQDRTDEQAEFLKSFTTEFITDGATGIVYEVLARRAGTASIEDTELWGLDTQDDNGSIQVRISNPGTIRKTSSLSSGMTISNLFTWNSPEPNDWMYIELKKSGDVLSAQIKLGEAWAEWPEVFEVTGTNPPVFSKHYYPLWRFYDKGYALTSGIFGTDIGELTAVKYAEPTSFQCYNVRWQAPNSGLVATVVQLLSSYRGGLS